jgi:hypothetical protein
MTQTPGVGGSIARFKHALSPDAKLTPYLPL